MSWGVRERRLRSCVAVSAAGVALKRQTTTAKTPKDRMVHVGLNPLCWLLGLEKKEVVVPILAWERCLQAPAH